MTYEVPFSTGPGSTVQIQMALINANHHRELFRPVSSIPYVEYISPIRVYTFKCHTRSNFVGQGAEIEQVYGSAMCRQRYLTNLVTR